MKKLLVLALVMGIASLATAEIEIVPGLEYDVDLGTKTITLTGTAVNGFVLNLMPDAGVLGGGVVAPAFTTINDSGLWAGAYGENGWAGASASNIAAVTGTVFTINYDTATEVTFYASGFTGNSAVTIDGQEIVLNGQTMTIPEPVTMALLGLGALVLRRKK